MEKRVVGKSGIEISVMGIGGWSYGGGDYWGPQAQADVDAVAHARTRSTVSTSLIPRRDTTRDGVRKQSVEP